MTNHEELTHKYIDKYINALDVVNRVETFVSHGIRALRGLDMEECREIMHVIDSFRKNNDEEHS